MKAYILSLFVFITLSRATAYAQEQTFDLQLGLSALEEGDDRYRPGFHIHFGWNAYSLRYFFFQQSFGPVRQRTHLLTGSRSFPIPGFEILSARFGLATLLENTRIRYASDIDQRFDRDQNPFNLGFLLGICWEYKNNGPLRLQAAWETALYPAGLIGGLLLSTGRKQMLSFSAGVAL